MIEIPARRGKALHLRRGQKARVVNTKGQQVVDTWAFNAADLSEFMSMEHSRVAMGRIIPAIGDALVTNRRRPILTLVEDNSGGIHDTLFAACDCWRYELLGSEGYHDNCTDNLAAAMRELGLAAAETPAPLNLFMNIPVLDGNRVEARAPVSTPGRARDAPDRGACRDFGLSRGAAIPGGSACRCRSAAAAADKPISCGRRRHSR